MEKQAIKELLYGGVSELMKNSRYYYKSSVGKSYCNWTDDGEIALKEFVTEITHFISEADKAELDRRAKQMVMDTLKGKE